jgi:GTPase SAR1 family protein
VVPVNRFKIVVLGDACVGKSSLLRKFCKGTFKGEYQMTIGVAYLKKEYTLKNGRQVTFLF